MMTLSNDSQAILGLCAHLGLAADPDLAPLSLREWNLLAKRIQESELKRPGGLLGKSADELHSLFDLSHGETTRIARLLGRMRSLQIELEQLAAKGIRAMTRADPDYPPRYRLRLRESAPVVLYYAGEPALLGQPGIAVVGSRRLDSAGEETAAFVGSACGYSGLVLYSGGAKGVDTISMNAALEARGTAVGVLADSLEKAIRLPEARRAIDQGNLCLVTPYSPVAGFTARGAIGRNRLIYCLADYAIVVASEVEKGGTWAGASETLKAGWVPVFVLEHPAMPEGNHRLILRGAAAFPYPFPEPFNKLPGWLDDHCLSQPSKTIQSGLF